jgi:hypothetical protein
MRRRKSRPEKQSAVFGSSSRQFRRGSGERGDAGALRLHLDLSGDSLCDSFELAGELS